MPDSGYERFEKAVSAIEQLDRESTAVERVSAAFAELNGFLLTGATDAVRKSIEAFGVQYNHQMQTAREATGDESASLSEPQAEELVAMLRTTCELVRSTESEQVLSRLRDHQRRLPEIEIELIRKYRDWFVPLLLEESLAETEKLEQLKHDNVASEIKPVSSVPFFSIHLASELGLNEFVPIMLRGLKLPGESPFHLYGDAIHEMVPRFLAQFLHDDIDQIDKLVLNASHNLYVRWASAGSYKYLVRDKAIALETAVERLDHLFELTKVIGDTGRPGMGHEYELSAGIVETISAIGGEAISMIGNSPNHWAFIDDSVVSRDEFVNSVAPSNPDDLAPELRSLEPTRLQDCVEEFRHWGTFNPVVRTERPPAPIPAPAPRPQPELRSNQSQTPEIKPLVRSDRTPRNAICPCGSGKKYKKCCMQA